MLMYDPKELARQFLRQHISQPDTVLEIRILGAAVRGSKIVRHNSAINSGYYDPDHIDKAVDDAWHFNGFGNIYFTLNPVHPQLICRADNRIETYARATTGDDGIAHINWLPVDVDPYRPTGISATTAEVAAALRRRDEVVAFVTEFLGDNHHMVGMSGNGGHALFRVDLHNTPESQSVLKAIGCGLSERFSDEIVPGTKFYDPPRVGVDNTVYNAARIWKLPGTIAVKGDSVDRYDRVHRTSTIELRDIIPADLGGMQ
jgi:hypothetical protein